jgi:hypothetical protein
MYPTRTIITTVLILILMLFCPTAGNVMFNKMRSKNLGFSPGRVGNYSVLVETKAVSAKLLY